MLRHVLFLSVLLVVCHLVSAQMPRCGSGPRAHSCIDGQSTCVNGKCSCDSPNVWGDPTFGCYRRNTVAAEMKMDPLLTSFSNESRPFPFPCRHLVTHVKQQLKDRNRAVIGQCEFQIHAFNAKEKGKFYTHGFDVATRIVYDSGRTVEMSSRFWGTATRGVYDFNQAGSMDQFLPNGPWGNDVVGYSDPDNQIEVKVEVEHENNQILYEFKKCGLRITFVPYDLKWRRNQVSMPGLAVAINCAMHPQWLSGDQVMALHPFWQGGKLLKEIRLFGLSDTETLLNRAFVNQYEQNQINDDNGQCEAVGNSLSTCNAMTRKKAFSGCFWMLNRPKFVKCVDGTAGARRILELFQMCVDSWCGSTSCSSVQQKIREYGCENSRQAPEVPYFLSGATCTPSAP